MRNKRIIFACTIVFLVLAWVAAAWIQPYKSGSEYRGGLKDYSEQFETALVELTVNDFPITINTYAPDSVYEASWMTTEAETVFKFGNFENCRIWINGVEATPGQSIALMIDNISETNLIPIRIIDDRSDNDRTVYLRTQPAALPVIRVEHYGNEAEPLDTFLYTMGAYIVKCDNEGKVLFYRVAGEAVDFQSTVTDSGKRYTWLEQTAAATEEKHAKYKAVVADEQFQIIDILDGANVDGAMMPLCENGFQILNDRDYILMAAKPDVTYPASISDELVGERVITYCMERRRDGETLWTWDTTGVHPALSTGDVLYDGGYQDRLAFSDVACDPDSGLVAADFKNLEKPLYLDVATGLAMQDGEITPMDIGYGLEAPFPVSWAQTDESGDYLIVSYEEPDKIAGSVYDARTGKLLEDIILVGGEAGETFRNKFVFDVN